MASKKKKGGPVDRFGRHDKGAVGAAQKPQGGKPSKLSNMAAAKKKER